MSNPTQSSSGGDKGAMSDKNGKFICPTCGIPAESKRQQAIHQEMRSHRGNKPTPDPIAFEEVLRAELNDIEVYVTMSMYDRILAAHNQSLQTAVTQALDKLKREIRIDYYRLHPEELPTLAELTKAKEQSHE